MMAAIDYAFDNPITLLTNGLLVRTASQAAELVTSNMRNRFTMQGLNTVLMLERAIAGDEIEEARAAFYAWAAQEGLA